MKKTLKNLLMMGAMATTLSANPTRITESQANGWLDSMGFHKIDTSICGVKDAYKFNCYLAPTEKPQAYVIAKDAKYFSDSPDSLIVIDDDETEIKVNRDEISFKKPEEETINYWNRNKWDFAKKMEQARSYSEENHPLQRYGVVNDDKLDLMKGYFTAVDNRGHTVPRYRCMCTFVAERPEDIIQYFKEFNQEMEYRIKQIK